MRVYFGKKKIDIEVKKVGFFGKIIGLMFHTKETKNLFFGKSRGMALHSWFVFFDFLVLWTDDKNKVVEWEIVKPFRNFVKSGRKFENIVEIPVNSRNERIIDFFVGKRKI